MAQIALKIYFDVGFQALIVFIGLGCFILRREASRFVLNFELQKRHFDEIRLLNSVIRNSVIINFLVNKSIFSQMNQCLL